MTEQVPTAPTQNVRVVIIGAGFGGLCTAIRLREQGITDFVVLERESDVGGTWHVNTYPGAQCDVPALLYSFSFAPNVEWSRLYPLQPEIQAYLRECAEKFGVLPHIRFGCDVREARWNEARCRWLVETTDNVIEAQFVVAGFGPFSAPSIPRLKGLEEFAGKAFHSAHWDHEHDLSGERVAVIGTGASAVQFIPKIQPKAAELRVFQRTPIWVAPHPDRPIGSALRRIWRSLPGAQWASRQAIGALFESLVPVLAKHPSLTAGLEWSARGHLRRQVADPVIREKLTPKYKFGCKRPTFSNTYYPALTAPNTRLVTEGIDRIVPEGILTTDGALHEVDTVIFGTGFEITHHPFGNRVIGRGGKTLADLWSGDPQAYLGTVVSGLPNFFVILGPNSAPYTSAVVTIEAQVNYILDCLSRTAAHDIEAIDVRGGVQRAFNEELDRDLRGSVWATGGCQSYYIGDSGRVISFWPGYAAQFKRRTRRVDLDDFTHTRGRSPESVPTR
ncbi:NAD(P)/FAD-dependent oxidoreductase [Mycobacterium sp. 1274756.6]|uniref:flavin-containing monooxygenase n=1 Tax=Mycobacterium sp. 1274756.6 TaxID=1834076 RepID=UPI0007FC3AE2|nr:NAD(P)/FAD-dependent oxidoreductase [Mycobacterium sp. 1274756.6]OBJ68017.1 cyclohexanone monooxygenase [Mycobacterium sp. 1274756.6]